LVKDINPGINPANIGDFTVLNDKLFFTANNGQLGRELWVTDGTENGTQLVKDINPGKGTANIDNFLVFDDRLFFTNLNDQNQYQLWSSDGTSKGTHSIEAIGNIDDEPRFSNPPFGAYDFTVVEDSLLFFVEDDREYKLWQVESQNSQSMANTENTENYFGLTENQLMGVYDNNLEFSQT
ncbi:MAG: ELWxxDGT repeat protein, partial [Cyanobacteria bacterium J06649_11]